MDGLELLVIGRTRFVELRYEDGRYVDLHGQPLETVQDRSCYACLSSFFTFSDEGIAFCPACGHMERKPFPELDDLLEWATGQRWDFLQRSQRGAFAAQTPEGWILRFAPSAEALERSAHFLRVHTLYNPKTGAVP